MASSVNTVKGGNHFIEVDQAQDDTKYLIIHSGSRNLGKQAAEFYQKLTVDLDRGYGEYFEKRDHLKGPAKRTEEDDKEFEASLEKLIEMRISQK